MSIPPFEIALWIGLLAAALGGLQGALFAAGQKTHRIDVLGVVVIGIITALGGSLLRDVVLNVPPVVIWDNWYLVVAGAAALLGMLLQPFISRVHWPLVVLDSVVMGLFGAVGASKALSLGVGWAGALVVGIIGAIGGGMVRDVILNLPVSFLHVGTLYAVAAGTGVTTLIVLTHFGVGILIAGVICVAVTVVVRVSAVIFGWTFPEQSAVHPRRSRPAAAGCRPG